MSVSKGVPTLVLVVHKFSTVRPGANPNNAAEGSLIMPFGLPPSIARVPASAACIEGSYVLTRAAPPRIGARQQPNYSPPARRIR